ncbi:laminin subunit beta-3 [Egretta garzetta]|uniref:laminin subunit beta-3 n=1 Tax=Egretta garzetta TaxID=188379 RepID=UPI00163C7E67|nr:laminin subunit beta-3 [Egretta garzetta]
MESRCQLWPRALFLLLACARLLGAERACSQGACYPPAADLLLGRAHHLRASSTCGLTKPETYCTPHGEGCVLLPPCRRPAAGTSPSPESILHVWPHQARDLLHAPRRGVERVTLQLDLDQTFQLGTILLHFRSPLPAAMLIERSTDSGKSWEVYQYLASDCAASFPHIPQGSPESWQDARCQALQGYPLHGGKVKFSIQDLASTITTSYSQTIDKLGQFTNLRINFTALPHIARQGYRSPSTFYAVMEMQVLGSCFCHGHADRCAPSGNLHAAQVQGHCVCQHNTAGPSCDRCAALYNDRPWAPAEDGDPHECQRCNCNGHAASCHFDPELYRASGGVSGGVCDGCQHNTEGNNCERCRTNYFRNQRQDLAHPEACLPCECDPDGTVPGSICDPLTGRCVCKENVQGDRCHLCKPGFAQLAHANPMGCHRCTCNALGTQRDRPCDDETGRCFCLPNVVGSDCGQCAAEHWEMGSGRGCRPCGCHPHGSRSPQCNQLTGQCPCRDGFTGRTCSATQEQVCPDRHYGDVWGGCTGRSSATEQSLAQVGSVLAAIREQVQGINPDLHFLDETASLSRELEALNSSLLITNTQYQSKKTQFENSRSTDLSGAFKTIRSAYQTSSNASSLVAGASGLLAESRESRRSAVELEGELVVSTSKLLTLKGEIASSPNLTPVINKIKTTEMSANQIQSNTRRLVDQMSVTRTQIEGDVRRIQQFIQQVRNFLSDKDVDPATIQEISESVLSLRLPTDAAAVLRKMTEIQNLATKLQCPESVLAQTAEDIAKAKQLQQEAEQARNRANAVEGNVEEVVGNLRRANTVLLEARGAIRGSGSSLRFIQERVDEIEAVLGPAEKNVKSIAGQLDGQHSQLCPGTVLDEAFEEVKQRYAELKERMEQSPALGEQGSRVQSINLEAQALFNETLAMLFRMETLEMEIRESNEAWLSKSARLSGLEDQVGKIRDAINKQVAYYESCS